MESEQAPPTLSSVRIVALTGFMAAGKSTIGRLLAALLQWPFVDLDCEIEQVCGRRVPEIFAEHGEAHFRKLEAGCLRSLLAQTTAPTVMALGGGTFVQKRNAEVLRKHGAHVVFLELQVEKLLQRCRTASERSGTNARPLAADEKAFCELYAQRLPSYRRAQLTVHTYNKTAEQVAREIATVLELRNVRHSL